MAFSRPIKGTRRPVFSAPLIDGMGLSEGRGFDRRSVVAHRVFEIAADAGGNDRAILRRSKEDVFRHFRAALEPVRVVEGPAVNAKSLRKPLKAEEKFCAAGRAKMDTDLLAAAFGRLG